jgi:hypothetical protein
MKIKIKLKIKAKSFYRIKSENILKMNQAQPFKLAS